MKIIAILIAAACVAACSSSDDATRALNAAGFTDITTHGYAVFGCSDSDDFATKFEATSPSGKRVTGVVCSGVFKGATIRF